MGIYHLSVNIIKRSEGRSSIAAAAYISGSKLTNSYDGLTHDYTRKEHIQYSNILLPQNAPIEYRKRETLWNAVEKSEKSSKSQLARSIVIALPKELSFEQQKELLEQYVQDNFVSKGMCADLAIHNPPKTNHVGIPIDENGNLTHDPAQMNYNNPHAHILLTMRPIDEKGKWESKSQVVYMCKKGMEEKGFTAKEYKECASEGWEKLYSYIDGKKKRWLTASEGEQFGLKRANRSPKTAPFGKVNPIIEEWNSLDTLKAWRKNWEIAANEAYKAYGLDERIDSRSFADQGRTDEIPSIHIGPAASHIMMIDNSIPDRVSLNQYIGKYNNWLNRAAERYHETIEKINTYIYNTALNILNAKNMLAKLKKKKSKLESYNDKLDNEISSYSSIINLVKNEFNYAKQANIVSKKKIEKWQKEYLASPMFNTIHRKKLQEKISREEKKIVNREENLLLLEANCNISDEKDIETVEAAVLELTDKHEKIREQIEKTDASIREYMEKADMAAGITDPMIRQAVQEEVDSILEANISQNKLYMIYSTKEKQRGL
ncbi:MobA/MobL family protein [Butyrivibrio sp. ob235]|uniref:MobQ family relaxase n=1 Tax=Butyrivibrio sp. ob235 TaxID=1761780 RepID=UPI0008C539FA|nr:MobQ family relaxase [Butyrivibrio sp. ob235]SEK65295.1 MobA/MobL family protein [Butyrivibrio sp. ob235]